MLTNCIRLMYFFFVLSYTAWSLLPGSPSFSSSTYLRKLAQVLASSDPWMACPSRNRHYQRNITMYVSSVIASLMSPYFGFCKSQLSRLQPIKHSLARPTLLKLPSPVISLLTYAMLTGSESPNASNTNFSHLQISHIHLTFIPS